jgi:tetratricopeptide (TPR) repeat protein
MTKKKLPETAVSELTRLKAVSNGSVPGANNMSNAEGQLALWEHAVQLFTQRKFDEACALFREVAAGPAAHIADKARSYLQICERKTARPEPLLRTVDDHFNVGVERLNAGDTARARFHFGQALELQPDSDHILYTLALCCGISGDGNGACENLKRAIGLDPTNRILARQDPEFLPLFAQIPALRALVSNDGY